MSTFVIATLAALSGGFAGLALGAQLSRLHGPAPNQLPANFAITSVLVLFATVASAILL